MGKRMERSPVQWVALVVGGAFALTGLAGFVATGFDNFAGEVFDEELAGLPLNPLHNTLHFVGGLIAVAASRSHKGAKRTGVALGILFLVSFVAGITGNLKYLAIENAASPDNWLHLATGVLALYFGTIGAGEPQPRPQRAPA